MPRRPRRSLPAAALLLLHLGLHILLSDGLQWQSVEAKGNSVFRTQSGAAGACPKRYLESWPPGCELPLCDAESMAAQEYLAGSWTRLPEACRFRTWAQLEDHTYQYRQECGNSAYACGIGTNGCYDRMLRISQWVWEPKVCQLEPFDAVRLSQSLRGKRVHFIGDSTMRQQFWSLGMLMEAGKVVTTDLWKVMSWTTIHNATFSVDGLEFLTGHRSDPRDKTFNSSAETGWVEAAAEADYLVFNTGFHHHRRDVEFRHYHTMLDTVLGTLKRVFRGKRLFFSTTHWAHEYCALNVAPLEQYRGSNGTYHWMAPLVKEVSWQDKADELGLKNFRVLNNSMDQLRGESHITWQKRVDGTVFDDCLHQCYPGVPDYNNWLVAHALITAAEETA